MELNYFSSSNSTCHMFSILSSKVGTSLGATRGLLLRGGSVLEKFAGVDTIVFDKTGTLTVGKPVVTKVLSSNDNSL